MQESARLAQPTEVQITDPSRDGIRCLDIGKHFRRKHRLLKHDVLPLLRESAHLGRAEVFIKLNGNTQTFGRVAIAVPKRILKRAIDRNSVKRVIREEFRQHALRAVPVDMLVTLRRVVGVQPNEHAMGKRQRQQLRGTLAQLFRDISSRFGGVA